MIDTATVLARPEVQSAIADVIVAGAIHFGVKPNHAWEMGDRYRAGLIEGRPLVSAIAIVDVVRQAIVEPSGDKLNPLQTANVVEWLDGPEHDGPRSDTAIVKITDATGRAIASVNARFLKDLVNYDADHRDEPSTIRAANAGDFLAADAEISALESQRENDGAGESGGLLNVE